jgi:phosphate-selective porin
MPALGSHVEVEGKIVNGILVAQEVEVQDDDNQEENELHGSITALNRDTKSFKMRYGINVKWDDATVFDGSLTNGAGSLTDGLKLDVKGKMQGNTLLATKIELDD